jgi:hypothetical protein
MTDTDMLAFAKATMNSLEEKTTLYPFQQSLLQHVLDAEKNGKLEIRFDRPRTSHTKSYINRMWAEMMYGEKAVQKAYEDAVTHGTGTIEVGDAGVIHRGYEEMQERVTAKPHYAWESDTDTAWARKGVELHVQRDFRPMFSINPIFAVSDPWPVYNLSDSVLALFADLAGCHTIADRNRIRARHAILADRRWRERNKRSPNS